MDYQVKLKHFSELSTDELYDIMAIRQDIFVVEQNCPYLDADGKDKFAHHLMIINKDGIILAYSRLLPEGISYGGYTSIGRVITKSSERGTGLGKKLMEQSIQSCGELFGKNYDIQIGAQSYLKLFYESLGFKTIGAEYLEDGIPHLHMIRRWL
ncbi:MAG: GNAT family N-acetyltransferase [Saprospiraceae bacterium]